MYSNIDLDDAVTAGALTPDAALAFRRFVAARQQSSLVDEEQFRLLTGFNDIFVAIAGIILLVAVGSLGELLGKGLHLLASADDGFGSPVAGLFVALTAWGLSEYFTRQRRMALPSILFLLAFAAGVMWLLVTSAAIMLPEAKERTVSVIVGVSGLVTALATYGHWRRFAVPITIAALAAALAGSVIAFTLASIPALRDEPFWPMLLCGVAVFLFAMRWDMSDRERRTRRSDVAFWLHLLAAPLIAHALFNLMHAFDRDISPVIGLTVILLYVIFGIVGLAIDRRALLVSSLAYVLFALHSLFAQVGALHFGVALTALVIGSALLLLSAFWHRTRAAIVALLPKDLADRLPPVHEPIGTAQVVH